MSEGVDPAVVTETLRFLRLGVDPAVVEDRAPPRVPVMAVLDFASAHSVAGPVARGLKAAEGTGHAAILLDRILAEEKAQLETLSGRAGEVIAAFAGAGVDVMFLKGGAHLVVNDFAPDVWRPMVDFDLFVRAGDLAEAARLIEGLGYAAPGKIAYDAAADHHLPAFVRGGEAMLELHDSLSWVSCPTALPPEAVWAESVRCDTRFGPALVPCLAHRAAHLVVHSQIGDHNHDRRALRLRDVIDWRLLTRDGGVDLEELARRFSRDGYGDEFRAFAALMSEIWEDGSVPDWRAAYATRNRTVLAGLADPSSLRKYLATDIARIVLASFLSRSRFRRLLANVTDPERRRMKIANLMAGFRR